MPRVWAMRIAAGSGAIVTYSIFILACSGWRFPRGLRLTMYQSCA